MDHQSCRAFESKSINRAIRTRHVSGKNRNTHGGRRRNFRLKLKQKKNLTKQRSRNWVTWKVSKDLKLWGFIQKLAREFFFIFQAQRCNLRVYLAARFHYKFKLKLPTFSQPTSVPCRSIIKCHVAADLLPSFIGPYKAAYESLGTLLSPLEESFSQEY